MISNLFNLPRVLKRLTAQAIDTLSLIAAFFLAVSIRLGEVYSSDSILVWCCLLICIVFTIVFGEKIGVYKTVVRFFGNQNIVSICSVVLASSVLMSLCLFFFSIALPRSTPIIYACLAILFMLGSRFGLRLLFQQYASGQIGEPVIIYGAGKAGNQLAMSLVHDNHYTPIAFIDDNPKLHGRCLQGIEVYPPSKIASMVEDYNVHQVLLAIANITQEQRKNIYEMLELLSVKVKIIPPYSQIVSGGLSVKSLRDVKVEDLLGRTPVEPVTKLMDKCVKNKVVMVTGAGGSIGSEMCRQLIRFSPKRLVLLDNSEFALYSIHNSIKSSSDENLSIIPVIGSVLDEALINELVSAHAVQTIYHAAAYKHVPLVEENVIEGVKNNVLGTYVVAKAAQNYNVENMVLISTDKAVRSTNIMGASKRVAEFILQAFSAAKDQKTCFSMVRFGNVLGSSGSVVPLFQAQIKKGGPLTVTHPEITRYFMTIPEAVQLVIQAGALAKGGEVFVLDMGQPVKIVDLAKKMIHLMGFTENSSSDRYVAIEFTGLRPGEKLYEELLVDDNALGTVHPRIMCARELSPSLEELELLVDSLKKAILDRDSDKVRGLLRDAPTGFAPNEPITSLVMNEADQTPISIKLH